MLLSVCVNDFKMAGQGGNKKPVWEIPREEIDLEEPAPRLLKVHLGCNLREVRVDDVSVHEQSEFLRGRRTAEAISGQPRVTLSMNEITAWSFDMQAQSGKCDERYCELSGRRSAELKRAGTSCAWMIINSARKTLKAKEGSIVARIGGPDSLWTANNGTMHVTSG